MTDPVPSDELQDVKACGDDCDTAVRPTAPGKPSITILPSNPSANDNLNCMVTLPSDAGSHTVVYTVAWTKDGEVVNELITPIVTADLLLPAETWTCTVTAAIQGHEGEYFTQSDVAEVLIQSSGPASPVIEIQPTNPSDSDNVICVLTTPSETSGTISYLYEWTLGASSMPQHTSPVLFSNQTQPDETWSCKVTPFDEGGQAGTPVTAEVGISTGTK
ncbi:MAG: hypothetical protein VX519_12815 [Myxococcota bacterium]|nr:hypothetical protein [Myxococcota bacterium]